MLQISNIVKDYKDVRALDNISFQVNEGKIFGLLGPNGAGKTTALRIILNIIKPTSGQVFFKGLKRTGDFHNIIGYLPEERGLYKKSKVCDVINYFGELKNLSRKETVEKSKKWLKRLEIEHYLNKKIEELSKGNQQKIQFITSVMHNPEILILDEPFSGFDPINQELIKEIITEFLDTGKLIILSTHMMEVAENLCNEIFLINKGKEVLRGSLENIKKRFGTNTFRVEYEGNGLHLNSLKNFNVIHLSNNVSEITIEEHITPSALLKKLVEVIDVKHFSYREPSLSNIFIETVKRSNG